jgi:hypothetical protein
VRDAGYCWHSWNGLVQERFLALIGIGRGAFRHFQEGFGFLLEAPLGIRRGISERRILSMAVE